MMNRHKPHGDVLIGAIAFCFIAVVIAVVVLFSVDPDGEGSLTLTTVLLGSLATTIASLAALYKASEATTETRRNADLLEHVDEKVDFLANGGTDSKVRAGIADVVRPEFLREEAAEMLDQDREHRAASPANGSGEGKRPPAPGAPLALG